MVVGSGMALTVQQREQLGPQPLNLPQPGRVQYSMSHVITLFTLSLQQSGNYK